MDMTEGQDLIVDDRGRGIFRVNRRVFTDPEILDLVRRTPPECHLPLSLLAAVHYLLLDGLDHPLGAVYAGRSGADPAPLFADVCRRHPDETTQEGADQRLAGLRGKRTCHGAM